MDQISIMVAFLPFVWKIGAEETVDTGTRLFTLQFGPFGLIFTMPV